MRQESSIPLDPRTKDLTGQTFGRLTVKAFAGYTHARQAQWICECIEGNVVTCLALNLKRGNSQSCGCLKRERTITAHTTHGKRSSPEYLVWNGMIQRCTNPGQKSYADYGARGITVCETWLNSFEAFYRDMGPRPSSQYTVERRNNTLGYTPENCFWATRTTQNRNSRKNIYLTLNGITQCAEQWASEIGIDRRTILWRKHRGWSDEQALTTPVSSSNSHINFKTSSSK
jgi:hypothetical protein